jgi:uncharacterized iron-regulated protein
VPTLFFYLGLIAQAAAGPAQMPSVYVPQRVYDTGQKAFTDFESMVAALARADVVFVGEQHDDPGTHRLEAAILEGLKRRQASATVSLEMFDRDAQDVLDRYLTESIKEDEFLKAARPWPRYATDYRPLVELAKANGWPVVAANAPRRHASEVAKTGLESIGRLPLEERSHVARDWHCPRDAYFDRFAAAMAEHPAPGEKDKKVSPEEERKRTERYYDSQCVKDETMAESIAAAFARKPGLIVHFNGAFHSEFGLGTAERTRRRLPDRKVLIVTILPVADLDALAPAGDDLKRADYLVYTVK